MYPEGEGSFFGMEDQEPKEATKAFDDSPVKATEDSKDDSNGDSKDDD